MPNDLTNSSPNRRAFTLGAMAAPALSAFTATPRKAARPGPFMLGADVTCIAEDEAAGAEYFVDNVRTEPFAILAGADFNYVRLRIFVNPQTGYSRREPQNRWGGLEQTLKLARRVKDAGMGLGPIDIQRIQIMAAASRTKPMKWTVLRS